MYDRRRIEQDFPSFRVTRTYKRFMHAPPPPVHGLPGEVLIGWHLWAHLDPVEPGGHPPVPGNDNALIQSSPSNLSGRGGLKVYVFPKISISDPGAVL